MDDVTGNDPGFVVYASDVSPVDNMPDSTVPMPAPPVKKVLSEAKLQQLANARIKAAEARKAKAKQREDARFDEMFEARFNRFMGKYEAERAAPPPPAPTPPSHPNVSMSSFLSRSAF